MIARTALMPLLSAASWLGVIQAVPGAAANDGMARSIGVASVLATLTVLVYRLGVWRQEMQNTKENVGAELKANREESSANFDRLERRLEAIDHMVSIATEQRTRVARWKTTTDRRLERLEQYHEETTQ